jgi:hypothetical protein
MTSNSGDGKLCCIYESYLQSRADTTQRGRSSSSIVKAAAFDILLFVGEGLTGIVSGAEDSTFDVIESLDKLPKVIKSGIPIWCLPSPLAMFLLSQCCFKPDFDSHYSTWLLYRHFSRGRVSCHLLHGPKPQLAVCMIGIAICSVRRGIGISTGVNMSPSLGYRWQAQALLGSATGL